jgi:hypothetical protein
MDSIKDAVRVRSLRGILLSAERKLIFFIAVFPDGIINSSVL